MQPVHTRLPRRVLRQRFRFWVCDCDCDCNCNLPLGVFDSDEGSSRGAVFRAIGLGHLKTHACKIENGLGLIMYCTHEQPKAQSKGTKKRYVFTRKA